MIKEVPRPRWTRDFSVRLSKLRRPRAANCNSAISKDMRPKFNHFSDGEISIPVISKDMRLGYDTAREISGDNFAEIEPEISCDPQKSGKSLF